jgi:N-ethylmaleimide reductase
LNFVRAFHNRPGVQITGCVYAHNYPLSASAINPEQISVTSAGRVPTVAPRPMTREDIRNTVADFGLAARNAMTAGFDGVQVQANYLYLLPQFLNRATNHRTDEYGGDIEGRARILFEVIEAILEEVEPSKVGVKIGPMHEAGPFAANDETLPMAEYAIRELSGYGLSHLLIMGNMTDFTGTPLEPLMGDGMFQHFRPIFRGTLIANVGMDTERANRLIAGGHADLVAFGRSFIANPDLVERLRTGAPLAEIDWTTVYGAGPKGYTDYPALELANT